jgi:glucose/arabinose dehydrogenase
MLTKTIVFTRHLCLPANCATNQLTNCATNQLTNQPTAQPTNQLRNQPTNCATNQPASQPEHNVGKLVWCAGHALVVVLRHCGVWCRLFPAFADQLFVPKLDISERFRQAVQSGHVLRLPHQIAHQMAALVVVRPGSHWLLCAFVADAVTFTWQVMFVH